MQSSRAQLFTKQSAKCWWISVSQLAVNIERLGMVDKSVMGVEEEPVCKWEPQNIINEPFKCGRGHGCLVLNREIKIPSHVAQNLWQNAALRYCVDGGANRWLHFLKTHVPSKYELKLPDAITGDFDSITEATQKYFEKRHVLSIHTPDQNATDFSKAVDAMKPVLRGDDVTELIVFHDTSGRFDQIMANINTLFTRQDNNLNIYLISGNSLTWLLRPGKHSISVPCELVTGSRWCSLIPIGHEAQVVTTKGLKWNLNRSCLSFGGMVSTSNTYAHNIVEIETDSALIWSMGIFSFHDD